MRGVSAYAPPLRTPKGVSLPDAVREAFGPRCPCCERPMTNTKVKKFMQTPSTHKTIAHDFSVARGGDAAAWFYGCFACNNEQGVLDLVTWARKLVHHEDPRAQRVVELAVFIRKWVAARYREDDEA